MKMHHLSIICLCLLFVAYGYGDTVVWSGKVKSDGTPTQSIKLQLGKKYQIKVSGLVNLGKWWQQGEALANDACYEFNSHVTPHKVDTFKNSLNIPVCTGEYHPDHIYQSNPFLAIQSGIHFWIYDTNYDDNNGNFDVQVIQVADEGK